MDELIIEILGNNVSSSIGNDTSSDAWEIKFNEVDIGKSLNVTYTVVEALLGTTDNIY